MTKGRNIKCIVIERFADIASELASFSDPDAVMRLEEIIRDSFPDLWISRLQNMFSKSDLIIGSVKRDWFEDGKINGVEIIFHSMEHGPTPIRIQLNTYTNEVEGFETRRLMLELTWRNTKIIEHSVECI